MKKLVKKVKRILFFLLVLVFPLYVLSSKNAPESAVEVRLQKGERGERVSLLQKKLKEAGLYSGSVNGIYDVGTAEAVKRFQSYNGIEPTGNCGPDTLLALGISGSAYSDFETETLARLIEAEAGGLDLRTMTAVGGVVMNRVASPRFPDSVAGVVFDNGAFESVKDGSCFKVRPSDMAYRAASDALNGSDPSDGALYVSRFDGENVTLYSGGLYFGK